jgi:hypothetical protein
MPVVDALRRALRGSQPLLLVPPALVVALGLDQGGFDPSAWVWAGGLAAWAVALAAVASRRVAVSRAGWGWSAAACSLLVFTAASTLWSERPTQSLLEARRTAVYAAVVLALVVAARRGAGRILVPAAWAGIVAIVLYSLTRYLVGPRPRDIFEGALLAQPLGYANAVGALAVMGLVLGLGLTMRTGPTTARAAAGGSLPMLACALALTHSRGSAVALAAGLPVLIALTPDTGRVLRRALRVGPPSAVAALVAALSHLSDVAAEPWRHAAALVAVATVGCAAWAAAAATSSGRGAGAVRRFPPRLGWGAGALLAAAAVAAVARTGSTEPRSSLWHVAWHEFEAHRTVGAGAGTFALAWVRSGLEATQGAALDAHSLYLETLAELGLVGLAALLAFLSLPLLRPRRLGSTDAAAAAAAYVTFLVHAGLDWDWELPAVVVAGLCCGAAALVESSEDAVELRRPGRAVLLTLALALGAVSIAGGRSRAEPGVTPKAPELVVRGGLVPALTVSARRGAGHGRAGRHLIAVAEMRLERLGRHGDQHPRMLLRVRPVADRHAVLPAR